MKKRPIKAWLKIPLRPRTYVRLWRLARIYPAPWSKEFWEPDFSLARRALRRGSAQKIHELTGFIAMLRREPPTTIVEIGTAQGGTLYALCQLASDDAFIVSIDLPGGEFGGGYSEAAAGRFASFVGKSQSLRCIRRDSHDEETVEMLRGALGGRTVDLLFIDGDHTYEGVKRDFELYSPLVGEGGLIAFHDIVLHPNSPSCKVDEFWDELKSSHWHAELIDLSDDHYNNGMWGGIGVIRKGPVISNGHESAHVGRAFTAPRSR
jgi:predicted O-methyltransferase YrrM